MVHATYDGHSFTDLQQQAVVLQFCAHTQCIVSADLSTCMMKGKGLNVMVGNACPDMLSRQSDELNASCINALRSCNTGSLLESACHS